jgi:hypothetical protein
MWIPLGLLDKDIVVLKKLNFCIVSKTNWVNTVDADESYDELFDNLIGIGSDDETYQ